MGPDGIKRLSHELWTCLTKDGGDKIEALKKIKTPVNRRGRVKRLLMRAIDDSTLGVFNHQIHYFGGKVYEPVSVSSLQKVIWDLMANKMDLPDVDLVHMNDIYNDCLNAVWSKPLKVRNDIMLFRNGVLDVAADKFYRKFDKQFVSLFAVDYDYVPGASTFMWYTFLNQVLPDKDMQDVLQMFLGATFIDRKKVKIENIMILLGKGANGKSVVQQTVCGVLGDEYVSTMEVGRLCSRGNDGDSAVASINGKRLNYCTEMEVTDFYKKSARLKAIVSGEDVTARQLYGRPYKAQNIPLLMANANEIPIFNHKDGALIRRIYVIPFNVTIPEERQRKTLADELVDEYPGILNWILEGRKKFIDNGYMLPPDVNLQKYIREEELEINSVIKYMVGVNGWLPRLESPDASMNALNWKTSKELFNGYVRWCKQNEIFSVNSRWFIKTLEDEGYVKRRFGEGYRFAVYGNITLNTLRRQVQQSGVQTSEDKRKIRQLWVDGTLWVYSMQAISEYSGVGVTTISTLNKQGYFDGFKKAHREKTIYNLEAVCNVMRKKFVLATDEQREIVMRIAKELKYMRYTFNQWAQYNGFPYRKYDKQEQIEDWVKVVPDEATYEEVIEMAREAGYDIRKATRYKKTPGAFGRGGKGFFDSVEEIPTLEEKSLVEEDNEEDEL